MTPCHVLFVCTGNTGRSVGAEALGRRLIAARALPLTVSSRGVAVDSRHAQPEPHLVTLLAARGIDISAHRAAALAAADVRAADHILTMTDQHKQIVLRRFPGAAGKLAMLSEAAHATQTDVADAFGGSMPVYERLLAALDALVGNALERLALA